MMEESSSMGKCDQAIYEHGDFVGILYDVEGAENIEGVVLSVRLRGYEVDWHYAAGRGIIKTLSNVDEVRNEFIKDGYRLYIGG